MTVNERGNDEIITNKKNAGLEKSRRSRTSLPWFVCLREWQTFSIRANQRVYRRKLRTYRTHRPTDLPRGTQTQKHTACRDKSLGLMRIISASLSLALLEQMQKKLKVKPENIRLAALGSGSYIAGSNERLLSRRQTFNIKHAPGITRGGGYILKQ